MSEEEKEAIEFAKKLIETIKQSKMLFDEDITVKLGIATQNTLQIVLNLIQKQQTELKKKDKTMNKMAEWIFDKDYTENSLLIHRDDYYSNCIKQVKQYFERKVENE